MDYKNIRISCIPDCGENEGGYFCEVHTQDCDDRIDYFCIHTFELEENPDPEYWMREYAENNYDAYVREGLIKPSPMQGQSI